MKRNLLEICCLITSLVIFYEHLPGLWFGSKSKNWESITGKVKEVSVSSCGKSGCVLNISYVYYLEGKEYIGNKIYAEQRNSFYPKQAAALYQLYKDTLAVRIYYDPDHKDRACLIPGHVQKDYYAHALLGLFFLIASIYFFIWQRHDS